MDEHVTEGLMPFTEQDDSQVIEGTLTLLEELINSVIKDVKMDCLETAVSILQSHLDNGNNVGKSHLTIYRHLIGALLVRYGVYGYVEDLDVCFRHLTSGVGPENIIEFLRRTNEESVVEIQIAAHLINASRNTIDINNLDTAIYIATESLSSHTSFKPTLHSAKLCVLLAKIHVMKYLNRGGIADLNEATKRFQEARLISRGENSLSYICFMSLSHIEWIRFMECGEIEGLLRHWEYRKKANELDQEGNNLSQAGTEMIKSAIDNAQLEEGITLLTASLHCRRKPHPRRFGTLNNAASALRTRFQRLGNFGELEECIIFLREALDLLPWPHSFRSMLLNNLGNVLSTRFRHKGDFQDLEESITRVREALDITNTSHPDRSGLLNNLGDALSTRFVYKGALHDLEESINLHREALDAQPITHPMRVTSLNNLAESLRKRFQTKGAFRDLEECLTLHREALNLRPPPHPDRSYCLGTLARALSIRFLHKGVFQDIEDSIALQREELDMLPPQHPNRFSVLDGLACDLATRFEHKGSFQDLEESIDFHRKALVLLSLHHPDRSISLHSLARALELRFKHERLSQDLKECISLHQEALDLRPSPHPNRSYSLSSLARALCIRFQHEEAPQDLDESILLQREALDLQSPHHPGFSVMLYNLAIALDLRFSHKGVLQDMHDALDSYRDASQHPTGSLIDRLNWSKDWATCAKKHSPASESALDAYNCAMELLPELASLDLTLQQRQDVLRHSRNLVNDAAKCAINASHCELAVVFLSTGRSIFWSQSLQLRTPVNKLMVTHPAIAEVFISSSKRLESASYGDHTSDSSLSTQRADTELHTSLHTLAEERQHIIEDIRSIPGYEGFLTAPKFSSLQFAANAGPVILLNASPHGCDGLLIHATKPLEHIALSDINLNDLQVLKTFIHDLLGPGLRSIEISQDERSTLRKLLGRDMVFKDSSNSSEETFRMALECLWVTVVEPVVRALGAEKTESPGRIWWCPTGPFASLPIHAAGVYSAHNQPIDCLFQYAISSYCASLQDLLHPPPQITRSFKMTAVIEPEAPNAAVLPDTLTELRQIKEHVPDEQHLSAHVGSTNCPNQVNDVVSDIQESSIVHFGCHGMQNLEDPLESYLLLSGGKLTMSKIIQECRVPEGALAYLSACETAKGDEERPDESLNLVATMMFAGFRSVVGTLWSIMDDDAPIVTDMFYRHLFRNGKETPPDIRDAAYGLHLATRELRDRGKSFYNWVPYVHYGI